MQRVIVVGGGVLGMMHALAARQRGHQVVHLEREPVPRGATVRNFGLIWISGRAPGAELALALRARDLWQQLASVVPGTGFRPHGSLTLARNDAEAALLRQAAGRPDAGERGCRLLDGAAVRALNPALRGAFGSGLYCEKDAIVEPRQVPAAIRDYLLAAGSPDSYTWLPCREAVDVAPRAVRDQTGTWHRGDLVILCTGAAHTGVAGRYLSRCDRPPLRRVRLQMLQTGAFGRRMSTSLADGDSLRYYPAYDLPRVRRPGTAATCGRSHGSAAPAGPAPRRQPDDRRHAFL